MTHGVFDNPPASGLRDFLVSRGARVLFVVHPLAPEHGDLHHVVTYTDGRERSRRSLRRRPRGMLTYAADVLWPLWPPAVDGWFGFNSLLAARGVLARRLGRARRAVYWAVDFVPDRFGAGTRPTAIYDRLDRWSCRNSNWRVDLSEAALRGRTARHALHAGGAAPGLVVPVGAWLDRVPRVPEDGWRARKVVFIGHLVPRQGVDRLIEAIALLYRRGNRVTLDIAGTGPQEGELRSLVEREGLQRIVTFHGFIDDHRALERFLATGSLAAAPYETSADSFTRFADPSKLKSYLAAGLPIIVTDVPHNAADLVRHAGAEIVPFDRDGLAAAIERCLVSPTEWMRRRDSALQYARRFDWNVLLSEALGRMGWQT